MSFCHQSLVAVVNVNVSSWRRGKTGWNVAVGYTWIHHVFSSTHHSGCGSILSTPEWTEDIPTPSNVKLVTFNLLVQMLPLLARILFCNPFTWQDSWHRVTVCTNADLLDIFTLDYFCFHLWWKVWHIITFWTSVGQWPPLLATCSALLLLAAFSLYPVGLAPGDKRKDE